MGDERLSFSVQLSSQRLDKVDGFYVYTSERLFNLPKGVFSRPFRVILTVLLTFVVLSLRVQPSQRTASPLRTQLCIPATVPLHGLLLQQAPPCLLLPHGWWAAVCVPTGIFTPLSWVQLSCFGYGSVSATAAGCVRRHIQGPHSMIQAGSDTECEKGIRYLGSHYQLPPEISDLLFIWPLHNCVCVCPPPECTIDRHFVFSVPASLTDPPLSPALLVAAGDSTCKPQRVTTDYALFKIPMDGCGTRRVVSFNEWKHFPQILESWVRTPCVRTVCLDCLDCLFQFLDHWVFTSVHILNCMAGSVLTDGGEDHDLHSGGHQ